MTYSPEHETAVAELLEVVETDAYDDNHRLLAQEVKFLRKYYSEAVNLAERINARYENLQTQYDTLLERYYEQKLEN